MGRNRDFFSPPYANPELTASIQNERKFRALAAPGVGVGWQEGQGSLVRRSLGLEYL